MMGCITNCRDRGALQLDWHVHYQKDGTPLHIGEYQTPELAIAAACRLFDAGHRVTGIGTGPLTATSPEVLGRILDLWLRSSSRQ